mgnify:CR=1 FL=1
MSFIFKINKALIYLSVILLPLIFFKGTFENFEFPKSIFVYSVLGFVAFSYFFLLFEIKDTSKIMLLFAFTFFISFLFSSHYHTSIFGYYTRFYGGALSIFIFLGVYLFAKKYFSEKNWHFIFVLIGLSGITPSLYGIFQYFQLFNTEKVTRITSTIGQPNWLAAFLAMTLPFLMNIFISESKKALKVFYALCILVLITGIWFTFSISGFISIFFGISYFMLVNLNKIGSQKIWFIIIFSIFAIIAFLNQGIFKDRVNDVLIDLSKSVQIDRIVYAQTQSTALSGYAASDSGAIRKGMWAGTLKLIFATPKNFLVGTGPETFAYEFQFYRPTNLNYTSEWNFVINKPHNYYLEIFANTGLLGLIAYSLIFYKSFTVNNHASRASLLTLCISNIFSWTTFSTALIFWLLYAYAERKPYEIEN